MKWLVLGVLALAGCRRVPPVDQGSLLEVRRLTLAFPKPELGQVSFELALPANVQRAGAVHWELYLGARRFAEGVAMAPPIVSEAGSGRRFARIESPLVFRHTGWREGGAYLDVGLAGHLQPLGGEQRWPFRARVEALVNAAPLLDERAE